MKLDKHKLKKQESVANKVVANKGSTLVAATGFGKTFTAVLVINKLIEPDFKVLVVVPTRELKKQWEGVLRQVKLLGYCEVVVINTAYKNTYKGIDLVIFDECHRVPAPEFAKALDTIEYNKVFCLTATLERADGEESKILEIAPVIETITLEDAKANNWVSDYIVYCLEIPLTSIELKEHAKLAKTFKWAAGKCGFGGDAFKNASAWLKTGSKQQRAWAGIYYNTMGKRKRLLHNAANKAKYAAKIALKSKRKGLIFSQTIDCAEEITTLLGNKALTYHGKLGKKERERVVKRLADNRTTTTFISSVQALNEGFDVPDCSIAIIAGGTSQKREQIQRTGRVLRTQPGKKGIIINLYIKGTQDEVWLRNRLDTQKCTWISKISEIEW